MFKTITRAVLRVTVRWVPSHRVERWKSNRITKEIKLTQNGYIDAYFFFIRCDVTSRSFFFNDFFRVSLLQIKGNYVVNENRLIPLFAHKCPLCGSKVKVEKLTYGVLIILNKQCIQCEYKDQWKSQVNARVPTDEDRHLTGGIDVTPETQQVGIADRPQYALCES